MLLSGNFGKVTFEDGQFTVELCGLFQRLTKQIVTGITPDCDYDLGDANCTVNLASFTFGGTVTSVETPRRVFHATTSQAHAPGYFADGRLEWLTGANAGLKMECKGFDGNQPGQFTLFLPMPFDIRVGDTFNASADRRHGSCSCRRGRKLRGGIGHNGGARQLGRRCVSAGPEAVSRPCGRARLGPRRWALVRVAREACANPRPSRAEWRPVLDKEEPACSFLQRSCAAWPQHCSAGQRR